MNRISNLAMTIAACVVGMALAGCTGDPYADLDAKLHEAARTNPPLEIVRGERVGPVHFGMTQAEVEEALGPPFRITGSAHEYQMLGFAVLFDREGRVARLLCGAWCEPSDILLDVFKGRTKDGIALGMALHDVTEILGPPRQTTEGPVKSEFGVFDYGDMQLAFRQDRLVHMTLMKSDKIE